MRQLPDRARRKPKANNPVPEETPSPPAEAVVTSSRSFPVVAIGASAGGLEALELLLAAVPDIIAEVDENKAYTWVNRAGLEFFGEGVIGKEAAFYFEGEQDTYAAVQPLFDGLDETFYVESWQRRRDGEKRLLGWWCRVLKDAQGNVRGALSTGRDITERKRAEEALRDSEERYRRLHESMTDCFVETRMSGEIQDVNLAYLAMLGYTREEVLRLRYQDITPARWHAFEQEIVETQIVPRGYSDVYEKEYIRKDGTIFPVELRTLMLRDGEGRPSGMWALIRDITERKRAEEALCESEARYRLLAENMADTVWLMDMDLRITYISPSVTRLRGYTLEELNSVPLEQQMTPDSLARTGQMLAEALAQPAPAAAEQPTSASAELEFYRKDGTRFWSDNTFVLIREADGAPRAILGVGRDITERKQAEEALAEGERKLRALFETMSEGIVYEDHEGNIISANPAAERLLGLSLDQMQGRTSLDPRWQAIHEDGSPFPGETHSLRVAAMAGQPGHDEIMGIYNPQLGAHTWLSINSTPEFLPGEKTPFRAYAVFRDITERKRAEEQLRYQAALLANVNDAIVASDAQYRLTAWNAAAESLYGWQAEEVLGRNGLEIVRTEWPEAQADEMRRTIAEVGRWRGEASQSRKDGTRMRVEVSTMVLRDESGEIMGYVSVNRDITARKREEAERNEQLDELRRWQAVTLGRETRILDLKRAVNELLAQSGQPPRFPSAETDDPGREKE